MPDPAYQAGAYQQPEQGGVSGALSRQLGPLKAWQWGVAIGGAVLLWKVAGGGGIGGGSSSDNPTTSAFVPSGDNTDNGSGDGSGIPSGTIIKLPDVVKTVTTKTISYYKTKLARKTAIRDKTGKVVGTLAAGRTILLGKIVKIGGVNYYPILNMPGKYVAASSVKVVPVYGASTNTTTTSGSQVVVSALTAASSSLASPTTTQTAQPYFKNAYTAPFSGVGSAPTIDATKQVQSLTVH